MTTDEQIKICKTLASTCMWGYEGIALSFVKGLDNLNMPLEKFSWAEVYENIKEIAKQETVGVADENELKRCIDEKYFICNYEPGKLSIHYPSSRGGGLYKYVLGILADKYGEMYDPWNYRVYQLRKL